MILNSPKQSVLWLGNEFYNSSLGTRVKNSWKTSYNDSVLGSVKDTAIDTSLSTSLYCKERVKLFI
jgi:hypothetical protein